MSRLRTPLVASILVALGAGLVVSPAAAAPAAESESVRPLAERARIAGTFGTPLTIQDWPLPTGDAGLAAANQGPQFGQGGLVSWNGALWFAEEQANQIGRIDVNGVITERRMPAPTGSPGYGPRQLSPGNADALWFLADGEPLDGRAARLNGAGTDIVGFHDIDGYLTFASISATPDGGAWITYGDGEGVSRLSPTGAHTYFEAPRYSNEAESTWGPDGAFWFSDGSTTIKRIDSAGSLTNHPATGDAGGQIVSMTTSGGSIWYAKFNPGSLATRSTGGVVARMSTSGVPTPYPSPYEDLIPAALTPGVAGDVWFTTHHGNGVGHLDSSGRYQVALMPEGHHADSVAIGPDGQLWYTDRELNRVGRISMVSFAASIASQTAAPAPPPGGQTGRAQVESGTTRVKNGKAKIAIRCVGDTACAGKVRVTDGKRKLSLAKGRYALVPGRTAHWVVKLTPAGTTLFRKARRAKLTVTLISSAGHKSSRRVVFKRR
ncbi:virginiamycin B lyase family protein [Nocardioides sp.]|uniref:Vgb family protein n=1 Tax=Nocardioides sp. TaxID=35761 RepID=UPI002C79A335|nr:hypothetical protein [Nocardioides sp.]HXH79196.1 hypothetical protein [Nocardioides sp.]